jgi:predicted lactoylglutathione lyase
MAKQVYINLPVKDLERSTKFYEALGFVKNDTFSNDKASAMAWSDDIFVMLLTYDFYQGFIRDKEIGDATTQSGALLALSLDTREDVQRFADTAKANGGDYYSVDYGVPAETMFGYEVLDPDGHQWEPVWMGENFDPQA